MPCPNWLNTGSIFLFFFFFFFFRFRPENAPRDVSVAEYFEREKRTRLRFPNLPLIEVGSKGTMLPLEVSDWI